MESIRTLVIDIDKGILKVNGQNVKETVIVTLPGPDGWPLQRMFNPKSDVLEECTRINVTLHSKL